MTVLPAIFIFASLFYWIVVTVSGIYNPIYLDVFGLLLTILPLMGFMIGLLIQMDWGGFKSYVGRGILFLSFSLLAWFLGQLFFFIFTYTLGEVPYPGLPDYFFVLIDPFYALALLAIMKFSGAKRSIGSSLSYLLLLLIPIASIYTNYILFFGSTSYFAEFDAAVLFDLLYSFGSIAIMTLIIITFVLSIKKLGGKMRVAIYMLFLGIVFQYIGDITYSLLDVQGFVDNGALSDFIYFVSISFVVLGLTQLSTNRLERSNES